MTPQLRLLEWSIIEKLPKMYENVQFGQNTHRFSVKNISETTLSHHRLSEKKTRHTRLSMQHSHRYFKMNFEFIVTKA